MCSWTYCVLLLLPLAAYAQIIHSIDRMSKSVALYPVLAERLESHLVEEENRIKRIRSHIEILKLENKKMNMSRKELEAEMAHPVRVYRFVSQFYSDIEDIRDSLDMSRISEELRETLSQLPSQKDYIDAVGAIARLQEVYKDEADFTRPQANNTIDVLTAEEVFDIGRTCSEMENYYGALNNLVRAKEMFEDRNDTVQAMAAYDHLAFVMFEQQNPDYALNYTYNLIDYYKDKDEEILTRLQDNRKLYIEELGGEELANQSLSLSRPYNNEPLEQLPIYNKLCRGESVELEAKESKPLQCHMHTNNNHPLLILAPVKKEDLHIETGLSFFHEVLSDKEIKLFQEKASGVFEDSQLVPDDDIKKDPNFEVKDDGYADTRVRSSNTGWVDDEMDVMVKTVSRRIAAILDLDLKSAESFQVLSYGIGGFYLPHFDWGDGENPFADFEGNRIATWIFYLNNIKKGGATVFPDIGATVWPEKGGAAFWRNLHRNGEGNRLTLHAACPVLEGYKWASNKWFHTVGNEFSWPCDVNPES